MPSLSVSMDQHLTLLSVFNLALLCFVGLLVVAITQVCKNESIFHAPEDSGLLSLVKLSLAEFPEARCLDGT